MPERQGPGRRLEDIECLEHDRRINELDNEAHKQSGWLKVASVLLSIAVIVIGAFDGMIFTKLTNIEGLLNDSKVALMQHSEQIKTLEFRVRDIEERNKYIDQQSGALGGIANIKRPEPTQ